MTKERPCGNQDMTSDNDVSARISNNFCGNMTRFLDEFLLLVILLLVLLLLLLLPLVVVVDDGFSCPPSSSSLTLLEVELQPSPALLLSTSCVKAVAASTR